MSNLILVLGDLGCNPEAQACSNQLAQVQPVPLYKCCDEGLAAMKAGDFAQARQVFREEGARAAYWPEFRFGLGLVNFGLGQVVGARCEIVKALEHSATVQDHRMYGAKLAWLNELRGQQRQRRRAPLMQEAGS